MNKPLLSLVFSFYATENFDENSANKLHFILLEKYHHLFTQSLFVIIVDDINNDELVKRVEQRIISCGFITNVQFKIIENTYYHEAYVFNKYIVDNLKKYEGLVFFAHNKGVTNVENDNYNEMTILLWVYMLYTMSLNYLDEAFQRCIELPSQSLFFGAIYDIKNMAYVGTIYLLCPRNIIKYLRGYNMKIDDILLDNRWFAEDFPSKILQNKNDACDSYLNKCTTHCLRRFEYVNEYDVYGYNNTIIGLKNMFKFLDNENYDSLMEEFDNICNKIKSN